MKRKATERPGAAGAIAYDLPLDRIPKTADDFGTLTAEGHRTVFLSAVFEVECKAKLSLMELLPDCPEGHYRDIHSRKFASIRRKLRGWAQRWHLTDRWCRNTALGLLLFLRYHAAMERPQEFTWKGTAPDVMKPAIPLCPEFSFLVRPGWDVLAMTRDAFEAKVRGAFQEALKEYCDRREVAARAHGLQKAPAEKRTLEHYRWLARYQVKGESFADIWRSLPQGDDRDRRAVEVAIHRTADEVGLTLRT